jgi:hypothetical protein
VPDQPAVSPVVAVFEQGARLIDCLASSGLIDDWLHRNRLYEARAAKAKHSGRRTADSGQQTAASEQQGHIKARGS